MVYCTESEKIEFLERRGFTVRKEVVKMAYPGYQNQMDYEDMEVTAVYNEDGRPYHKPGGYNFKKGDWLESAFGAQANIVFKEVVLGIKEVKPEKPGVLDQVLTEQG